MVRVPSSVLRQIVTIEPWLGQTGSGGPAYGTPVTGVRARVERRRRQVRVADGVDVMSTATMFVRPDVQVAEQARVTHDGRLYTVLEVLDGQALTQRSHREVLLS